METHRGKQSPEELARQRSSAAVDSHRDDYLQLLIDLVKCPTLLGQEGPGQDLLYRRLLDLGLEAERWDLDTENLAEHPAFAPVSGDTRKDRTFGGPSSLPEKGGDRSS